MPIMYYICILNYTLYIKLLNYMKNKVFKTEVKVEYNEEYKDKGPVLYAKRIEAAEPPEEELVYF